MLVINWFVFQFGRWQAGDKSQRPFLDMSLEVGGDLLWVGIWKTYLTLEVYLALPSYRNTYLQQSLWACCYEEREREREKQIQSVRCIYEVYLSYTSARTIKRHI